MVLCAREFLQMCCCCLHQTCESPIPSKEMARSTTASRCSLGFRHPSVEGRGNQATCNQSDRHGDALVQRPSSQLLTPHHPEGQGAAGFACGRSRHPDSKSHNNEQQVPKYCDPRTAQHTEHRQLSSASCVPGTTPGASTAVFIVFTVLFHGPSQGGLSSSFRDEDVEASRS